MYVLMVGCDNAGKRTLLEHIKKMEGLRVGGQGPKQDPHATISLNMAIIGKSQGEFVLWDSMVGNCQGKNG